MILILIMEIIIDVHTNKQTPKAFWRDEIESNTKMDFNILPTEIKQPPKSRFECLAGSKTSLKATLTKQVVEHLFL